MSRQDAARALARLVGRGGRAQGAQEATVTRVDEQGTAWASVDGGAEFPLAQGVAASAGQTVAVEWRNGAYVATGNYSDPPDNSIARDAARVAEAADGAVVAIAGEVARVEREAKDADDQIAGNVERVERATGDALDEIRGDVKEASDAASEARASADGAACALSDVERVVGTVGWIAEHGEYVPQAGQEFDGSKVYYEVDESDPSGYSVVAEPDAGKIGSYYVLRVDESVQNYINSHLYLLDDGLYVTAGDTGHKVRIDADSLDVLAPDGAVIATFGKDAARIGESDEAHMELDYHSMRIVDDAGDAFVWMSDLRDADGRMRDGDGYDDFTDEFTGADAVEFQDDFYAFFLSRPFTSRDWHEVDAPTAPGTGPVLFTALDEDGTEHYMAVGVRGKPDDEAVVTVSYESTSSLNKAFTLGRRDGGAAVGAMSVCEGMMCSAPGVASHAEGDDTSASGYASHAEGWRAKASGYAAHAEGESTWATGEGSHSEGWVTRATGKQSHAEGNRTRATGDRSHAEGDMSDASGEASHAEGRSTRASGAASHAQGVYTVAAGDAQAALGRFNEEDEAGEYAVVVGNGSSDSARSNALAVRWDGLVDVAGMTAVPAFDVGGAWAGNEAAFVEALPVRPCVAFSSDGYALRFDADPSTDS